MPGRDYTKAHALLQESLAGDVSYPSLPWMKHRGRTSSLPESRAASSTLPLSRHPVYGEDGQRETHLLPPTPPDNNHEVDPSFGLAKGIQLSDRSSSTRPSTPFNFGSSITPDTQLTPPSLGSRADNKSSNLLNYRSSHGESFTTAREDLASRSSQGGSRSFLPLPSARDAERASPRPASDSHWGVHGALSTETRSFSNHVLESMQYDTLASEGTGRLSPNRTKRRRRRTRAPPNELTFLDDRRESEPDFKNDESPHSWYIVSGPEDDEEEEEEEQTPRTPNLPKSNDKEADFINMTPPKRLPSNSKSYAVIEAEIRESPDTTPKREHRLRHYHKIDAFRDDNHGPERYTPVSLDGADSPIVNPKKVDLLSDADVRAKTRSSLVASLPAGLKITNPSWRRTKSLVVTRSPRSAQSAFHSRSSSDAVSDILGDHPFRQSLPLDQLYGLPDDGSVSRTQATPKELQHLHARKSSGHLTAETQVERLSGTLSARHTLTRASPFSEVSEGLIVNDARAISIVPHNNNSLLLVNQQPSTHSSNGPSPVASKRETAQEVQALQQDRPSTPGNRNADAIAAESPLTRPRDAPEPPAISVTPPTPAKDLGVGVASHQPVVRPPLTRHESLLKRAIRTFSAPRASITRRNVTRSEQNASGDSPRKKLHPFWQPRGFWEDFSDAGEAINDGDEPIQGNDTGVFDELDSLARGGTSVPQRGRSFRRMFASRQNSPLRRSKQARPASYPGPIWNGRAFEPPYEKPQGLSKAALQRLASLRERVGQLGSVGTSGANRSSSQRRRLTLGFKEKIQERTQRREERRREQERERIRESIGPRFYVDTSGIGDERNHE